MINLTSKGFPEHLDDCIPMSHNVALVNKVLHENAPLFQSRPNYTLLLQLFETLVTDELGTKDGILVVVDLLLKLTAFRYATFIYVSIGGEWRLVEVLGTMDKAKEWAVNCEQTPLKWCKFEDQVWFGEEATSKTCTYRISERVLDS